MSEAIDWRAIFVAYVVRVVRNEGVTFLYESDWTSDQWRAIQSADPEIEAQLTSAHARKVETILRSPPRPTRVGGR